MPVKAPVFETGAMDHYATSPVFWNSVYNTTQEIVKKRDIEFLSSLCTYQDSNLDQWFRKPLFYPLNYRCFFYSGIVRWRAVFVNLRYNGYIMRRGEISLTPQQRKILTLLSGIPHTFQERLQHVQDSSSLESVFVSERELEKLLDILPPPPLSSHNENILREVLLQRLQTL